MRSCISDSLYQWGVTSHNYETVVVYSYALTGPAALYAPDTCVCARARVRVCVCLIVLCVCVVCACECACVVYEPMSVSVRLRMCVSRARALSLSLALSRARSLSVQTHTSFSQAHNERWRAQVARRALARACLLQTAIKETS